MNQKNKWWPQPIVGLSFLFLGWRSLLWLVAWIAPLVLEYRPSFPYAVELPGYHLAAWLYSWANFDGVHYLTIAAKGYIGTGLIQAFFPVYPYLLKYLNLLVSNYLLSGLIISNLALLMLMGIWFKYVRELSNSRQAWWAVVVLLLFPSSLFLGALYGESLFLLLSILSLWAAKNQKWGLMTVSTLVAVSTRVVGLALIPALLLEVWLQFNHYQPVKKWQFQQVPAFLKQYLIPMILILLSGSSLLIYMRFLSQEFKDPFYFLHVQSEFGGGRSEALVLYPQVVWRYLKILETARPFDFKYLTYLQEFISGVGGLLLIIISAIKLPPKTWSLTLFSILTFIIPTLTGTFSSMPRYLLASPIIFYLLAKLLANKTTSIWLKVLYLIISGGFLILNTLLFIQGYWVA